MPQFLYRAARPDGTVVVDRVQGDNEATVRSQLEGQGLLIFSLAGSQGWALPPGIRGRDGHLSLREFLVFNQEFLALARAGLPILTLINLLAERSGNPRFQAVLQGVRSEIRGGFSISEAMGCYPSYFPDLYRASLRSGEQTGRLPDVLKRYIAYLKLVIGVREKVLTALAYPVFLLIVGAAVVSFLLIYVMPTFVDIYGHGKAQLPWPTRLLLAVVEDARRWLPWVSAGILGLAALAVRWLKTPAGRELFDRFSLRLPMVGDVLLMSQTIRMARTLSTVLAGGIPLLSALQITSGTITNRVISRGLDRATDRVRDGAGLAASLKQELVLPRMTIEMIEIGETTGELEVMLQDVAEFHEGELDLRLSQLTTWIEPVLLLVMGVIVGGIVIVMYLPIFQMAGTIS